MPFEILTINVGSSSVKTAVFEAGVDLRRVAAADLSRADSDNAVRAALSALPLDAHQPAAVVHRIVHGGTERAEPTRITPNVLDGLRGLQRLAPDHLPPSLDAIEVAGTLLPNVPQFACFDTAFHHRMPDLARMYPLPRRFWDAGVRRYGFHGLSCESVLETLRRADPDAASGRLIVAHLGSGSSLTAIRNGRGEDTTMGFSPAGGVMMGSRSGDLDPGVLLYAMQEERLDVEGLRRLVTREAGLKGVSGRIGDMRDLLAAEALDPRAADAVNLYCYIVRKALGSLMAVLGGLDALVFTGGIGEHAASVRERVLEGMAGLGLQIDPGRNRSHEDVISSLESPVTMRVVPSNEDRMLASHAVTLLSRSS